MACGLPVVATPTGMAKDLVVPGETGYFYPFNNPEAVIAMLQRIKDEDWWGTPEQIQRSRAMAEAFTWKSVAARYRAAYAELYSQLVHHTSTRSWVGGELAKTRCLSRKEMGSALYLRILDDLHLRGKGYARDWEYPAVLAELWPEYPKAPLGNTLLVGASNDLLALALCREYAGCVTCVDPAGFEAPWWFEDENRAVVPDAPANLPSTEWPDGPTYIKSTLQAAGLSTNTYDVVISVSVLEHDPNPIEALRTVARVLRPGGRLIMTVEYTSGFSSIIPELHLTTVDKEQLRLWALRSGLRFVGGQDWNTREGAGVMRRKMPPHLQERFIGKTVPYFTPLIVVLEKPK
jgi:SAM-dependent methyltransferase